MIAGMPRACARGLSLPGSGQVTGGSPVPGAVHAVLVPGVALLRPEEQVLEAMLAGWQASRVRAAWAARRSAAAGTDTVLHRARGVPAVAVDAAAVRGVVR